MANDRLGEQTQAPHNSDNDFMSSVRREAYVLGSGTASGFSSQLRDYQEHPGEAALKAGTGLAVGVGLGMLQRTGGIGRVLATTAGATMGLAFVNDIAKHISPTVGALTEAWTSGRNLDANKDVVANSLGRFTADSLLMTAGSFAGVGAVKLYDRIPSFASGTPFGGTPHEFGTAAPRELGAIKMSDADHPTLKYDIDQAKVMDAFGPDKRAIPSMNIVDGKLQQQVSIMDKNSPAFQLYERIQPSVLKLRWSDGNNGNSGTAFPIEDGEFLATAHHMVARSRGNTEGTMKVELGDGREVPVNVVARDVGADIALLRYSSPIENPPPALSLGWASDVHQWEGLNAFGYPALANKTVLTQGRFLEAYTSKSAGSSEAGLETTVQSPIARLGSRASTWSGNSGGPLTNAKGEVVGVITAGEPVEAESYSTAVEHLRLLLNEARRNPIPAHGLIVNSIGRVIPGGEGYGDFTIKAQRLDLTVGDTIERPLKSNL